MSFFVVWTDSEQAKIFDFTAAGASEHIVKRRGHHPAVGHTGDIKHRDEDKFFADVATHLQRATEILIVGPGLAKTHLKAYLEKHRAHDLGARVVGVEAMDHPTDPEVVAFARRFFKANHDFFFARRA